MFGESWSDMRFGLRTLSRSPGFTVAAVLTLALGIGANTAIFSLADAVLFRPFPVREPGRLAVLYTTSTTDSTYASTSYPDYIDYTELEETFAGLLAYARIPFVIDTGQHTERIQGEVVSSNYFDVLGLGVSPGRRFLPSDEAPGAEPVAILSRGLSWSPSTSGPRSTAMLSGPATLRHWAYR